MAREEELVQKAKEVREALIAMAADEVDATHIEVGQIKAKDDTRELLTVRVANANRYVAYAGHDTSEFTVGDYWAIIFDDYGTIRLGWWTSNAAGGGIAPTSPHKDTHDPQTGTDPLDCGSPTTIQAVDTAPAESAADEFARSEHVHGIDVGVPSDVGVANIEGTSYEFVRKDHVHNHPAALGTDLHHALIHTHEDDAEGGLLRIVHIHAYKEDKSAECDGAKVTFFTAQQFEPHTLRVFHERLEQVEGMVDYSEGAMFDHFDMVAAPNPGDKLIVHYLAQRV